MRRVTKPSGDKLTREKIAESKACRPAFSPMIYCFDTSAINQLCDDVEREGIVTGLLATNSIYVTAANCIEVLGTKNEARREQLQILLRELAAGQAPLALPIDLLKILTMAYAAGQDRPASEDLNYRMSVDDYFTLDGKEKQEIQELRTKWEASFDVFRKGRPILAKIFKSGKTNRPSSFAALIRDHYKEKAFLFSMMEDLYTITGEKLAADKLNDFFAAIPEWPIVLLGLAYASYARSVKEEGYGKRGKAGAIDLWSAAYLPHSDIFVTHDKDQFCGLRLANIANSRPTTTLRFGEFRKRLLIE